MKRINIMLMTITVAATLGCLLAFKASQTGHYLHCTSEFDELNPTNCPEIILDAALTGPTFFERSSCTDKHDGNCAPTDIYFNE